MPRDRLRIRAGIEAVRAVLWRDWDTLDLAGIAPDDEYDSYAVRAYGMAHTGQGVAAIADYLLSVERTMMNLETTPAAKERAMRVAGLLISLRPPVAAKPDEP